jgi:hypothetical protein
MSNSANVETNSDNCINGRTCRNGNRIRRAYIVVSRAFNPQHYLRICFCHELADCESNGVHSGVRFPRSRLYSLPSFDLGQSQKDLTAVEQALTADGAIA